MRIIESLAVMFPAIALYALVISVVLLAAFGARKLERIGGGANYFFLARNLTLGLTGGAVFSLVVSFHPAPLDGEVARVSHLYFMSMGLSYSVFYQLNKLHERWLMKHVCFGVFLHCLAITCFAGGLCNAALAQGKMTESFAEVQAIAGLVGLIFFTVLAGGYLVVKRLCDFAGAEVEKQVQQLSPVSQLK